MGEELDDETTMAILNSMVWNDSADEELEIKSGETVVRQSEEILGGDDDEVSSATEGSLKSIFCTLDLKSTLESIPSHSVSAMSGDASISLDTETLKLWEAMLTAQPSASAQCLQNSAEEEAKLLICRYYTAMNRH